MIANNMLELIGRTPILRLSRVFPSHLVYMKLERFNPGGSIKDRAALSMIREAERRGELKPGATIIEPTSGNTGVGLAMVASILGYSLILVMPESMSIERRRLMYAYGAKIELTSKELGMRGSIERAKELQKNIPGAWIAGQFENPANPLAHERTTGPEIIADFPEGVDVLITTFGSGGHITGLSHVLKKAWPSLKVIGVEPAASPLVSKGIAAPHKIQGIGANFVPQNFDPEAVDEIMTVSDEDAYAWTQKLGRQEGLLTGISTGAAAAAVADYLKRSPKNSRILTMNYDTGERYFSVPGLFEG